MGLHVLAFNGLLIRQARSYILRCHGCFRYVGYRCTSWLLAGKPWGIHGAYVLLSRTTSTMTRLFCPHCGNKTLKKVAVTVKDDGSFHLHFSQNPKVLNPRGLRVSAPSWWSAFASPFPSSGRCFSSTAPPPHEKCWAGSS